MSIALLLAAALATQAGPPDFRQMQGDATTALVVDLSAISTDSDGMRHVVVYAARKTPQQAFRHKGEFLYGKFVYSVDCSLKKLTTQETVVYTDRFTVVDDVHSSGPLWVDASRLPLVTYCAARPSASSEGVRVKASDWQGALREVHTRLLGR